MSYLGPHPWIYGAPPHGYYDPEWEEKERVSGLKSKIDLLERVLAKVKKGTTHHILFNELCACNAAVAAIVLSRP